MMKLFAIYVGGSVKGANIEQHDMRFVVAYSIKETYAALREQWWGIPSSLHIDCWAEISHVDGYTVTLHTDIPNTAQKLYYVNVGGYDGQDFAELHKNCFVVAENEAKAKIHALKTVRHWRAFHKDDLFDADDVIALKQFEGGKRLYVHLEKVSETLPLPFTCEYRNIGRLAKRKQA